MIQDENVPRFIQSQPIKSHLISEADLRPCRIRPPGFRLVDTNMDIVSVVRLTADTIHQTPEELRFVLNRQGNMDER